MKVHGKNIIASSEREALMKMGRLAIMEELTIQDNIIKKLSEDLNNFKVAETELTKEAQHLEEQKEKINEIKRSSIRQFFSSLLSVFLLKK